MLNTKTLLITTTSIFVFATSMAQQAPATLRAAMTSALTLNSITRSTDELLESVHFSTLATKASMMPAGYIYCGSTISKSDTNPKLGPDYKGKDRNQNCGVSASVTLYDGGANYASYRAAKANEEVYKNLYNTADSYIPNTRGGLAFNTLNAYMNLAESRAKIKFYNEQVAAYQAFKKAATHPSLDSGLIDSETSLADSSNEEIVYRNEMTHLTTLEPASELESLDQSIESLRIPSTADQAIDLALSNGPEVLRRDAEVEWATWNLKSIRASLGPSVSVTASASKGGYHDYLESMYGSKSTNQSIGLTASLPLTYGGRYYTKSAEKTLSSKKLERKAAIDNARHAIKTNYMELENLKKSYLAFSKTYEDQAKLVSDTVKKIEEGQGTGYDGNMLASLVGNRSYLHMMLINKQKMIIYKLFAIQQVTGLLFTDFTMITKK